MRIHNRVPLWTVAMQHISDWVSWALVHVHSQTHTHTHTHILLLAYEYQITHIILCHTHPPRLPQDTAALPRPRMEWGETQGSPGGEKPCVGLCSSAVASLDELLRDVWWFFSLNCRFIYLFPQLEMQKHICDFPFDALQTCLLKVRPTSHNAFAALFSAVQLYVCYRRRSVLMEIGGSSCKLNIHMRAVNCKQNIYSSQRVWCNCGSAALSLFKRHVSSKNKVMYFKD